VPVFDIIAVAVFPFLQRVNMHNLSLPYGFHVDMIKADIETAFIIFKQLPPFCNSWIGSSLRLTFILKLLCKFVM
jgi:hypothetical protein